MTAADHANTVRETLDYMERITLALGRGGTRTKALASGRAALDALAAQAETADDWAAQADDAEAQRDEMKAERDAAVRKADFLANRLHSGPEINRLHELIDLKNDERDAAVQAADTLAIAATRRLERAEAAEQAAEQAHAALQKIQQASTLRNARELARWELDRAALAGNQP